MDVFDFCYLFDVFGFGFWCCFWVFFFGWFGCFIGWVLVEVVFGVGLGVFVLLVVVFV